MKSGGSRLSLVTSRSDPPPPVEHELHGRYRVSLVHEGAPQPMGAAGLCEVTPTGFEPVSPP